MIILDPTGLAEYFQLLLGAYKENTSGKPLVQCLREDWGLFDHERMDDSHAKDLLGEILDDGEIVRRRFTPLSEAMPGRVGQWETLRDELMYKNRFFPRADIDLDRLEHLLSHLLIDAQELPSRWYRARIQGSKQTYKIGEMGAPSKRASSHGRANPAGIPYLYLASTESTAVSEIRPHTGEVACIAEFSIPDTLKLVDLRQPKKTVSPFVLIEASEVIRMSGDLPFLERLGEELTRPVLPQAAAIDYTPSQYLCEFIKKCGYNGVLYRSSVADGINLALFSPESAKGLSVSAIMVKRVTVETSTIPKPKGATQG